MNISNIGYKIACIYYDDGNKSFLSLDINNIPRQTFSNNQPQSFQKPICEFCKKQYYSKWDLKIHQSKSCRSKQLVDLLNAQGIVYNNGMGFTNNFKLTSPGRLVPYPLNTREIIYIAGPAGSGKSHYASEYMKEYSKKYPRNNIFLFSRIEEDNVFTGIKKLKRINPEKLMENEDIDPKITFSKSLCVFDDSEYMDQEVQKKIESIKNDLIKHGRDQTDSKKDIYMIVTSHQSMNFRQSRDILNEATSITFFPQSSIPYHIKRLLKVYCGLDNNTINDVIKLPSRWVSIYTHYPQYVLTQNECFLLCK